MCCRLSRTMTVEGWWGYCGYDENHKPKPNTTTIFSMASSRKEMVFIQEKRKIKPNNSLKFAFYYKLVAKNKKKYFKL